MIELIEVEVAVELGVENPEDVLVEFRRHAGRVVIGGYQDLSILYQIGAEQERIAVPQLCPQVGQELGAVGRQKIANGAAEEDDQPRSARFWEAEVLGEVGQHSLHVQAGIPG